MPAQALKCKECGATYALEARFVCEHCFGPLEVSYDHSRARDAAELQRKIQAGPPSIWRYADFLPFERPPRTALDVGLHAADPLDAAGRAARAWARCSSRTTPPTPPTRSRTGS